VSFNGLLVHDATILRAGTTVDRYGNTVPDWDDPTETGVKAWITQVSRSEVNDGRTAVISAWVAFFHADTDIVAGDRVEWPVGAPDTTFEVDGLPHRAWTPRGEHHVEANLRVVSG
jgi:hypothetical protein